ncbi:MAG: hypothetical protein L6R41_007505 [Letrouitia leprolyta]|nr:MAG: hypothetical protein L6R41_007505 [Letrouitia leprolyta]
MRVLTYIAVLLNAYLSFAHFSLSDLQPIAGFSEACTQAYEAPLTECTISDFYVGATCSPQCVAYLEAITKLLNDECRGIIAYPNTLIGMFFKKTAVKRLCPNVGVTTITPGGAGQGSRPEPTAGSAGSVAAFTQVSITPAAPSQISIEVTSMTSKVEITTATSSTLTTSTIPSTSSITASVALISGAASSGSAVSGESAAASSLPTAALSSSGTDQASPTAGSQATGGSAQGSNNGDGGTVLDAASMADRGARAGAWQLLISIGLAAVVWSI